MRLPRFIILLFVRAAALKKSSVWKKKTHFRTVGRNMPYEDFLIERRKLMAEKIKAAFEQLKKNVE